MKMQTTSTQNKLNGWHRVYDRSVKTMNTNYSIWIVFNLYPEQRLLTLDWLSTVLNDSKHPNNYNNPNNPNNPNNEQSKPDTNCVSNLKVWLAP